jgi:hypothetical protein
MAARRPHRRSTQMAKGQQRSNKEQKKPKKDAGAAKPVSPPIVMPVTTVIERGKKKFK